MTNKLKPKKCKKCRGQFIPKTEWQKFCSRRCRAAVEYIKTKKLVRAGQKALEAAMEKGAA